jgi:ribonuclease P protein component
MRLRQRAEFLAVQSGGIKVHGRHVLAIAKRRASADAVGRLGITVTKKVGNSPVRNRIRRVVREWFRLNGWVPAGWDLVVVAKESAARQVSSSPSEGFVPDLARVLRDLKAQPAQ